MLIQCRSCNGTGRSRYIPDEFPCPACKGSGTKIIDLDQVFVRLGWFIVAMSFLRALELFLR
jgi:DnaJ-class molecular chaperone